MTTVEVTLPDQLAREAQQFGLLAPESVEKLLRQELHTRRVGELFAAMDRMNDLDVIPQLTPEEIAVELAKMRTESR